MKAFGIVKSLILSIFIISASLYLCAEPVWQPVFLKTPAMKAAGMAGGEAGQYQTCMERSLSNPDILLTGIDVGGVVKSADNGKTWFFPKLEGLRAGAVSSVAFNPKDANIIYAYGHHVNYKEESLEGFYRSTDGGNNWELTLDLTEKIEKKAEKPRIYYQHHQIEVEEKTGTIYFGSWVTGLFKSKKGGVAGSWEKKGLEGKYIRHVKLDPFAPNKLLVGTDEGEIWKSIDGGDKWWKIFPAAGKKIEDPGKKKYGPGGRAAIGSLKFDPLIKNLVYLVIENSGLFKSTDGGETFEIFANRSKAFLFDVSPLDSNYMYLMTHDKDAYFSHDGGKEWKPAEVNAKLQFIREGWIGNPSTGMSPDPRDKNKACISIGTRIYRTKDGGENWNPSGEGNPGFNYGWSAPSTNHYFDPVDPKRAWTFNLDFGTVMTEDGWDTAFCYSHGDTKWKDGTWSWGSCLYGGVIVKEKAKERWVVLGGKYFRNTIYLSEDKGKTWHFVEGEGKFPIELGYAEAILQHPGNQNIIYCSNLISRDGGRTWQKMSDGQYRVLGVFKKNGDIIYSVKGEKKKSRSIYKSIDQGGNLGRTPLTASGKRQPYRVSLAWYGGICG